MLAMNYHDALALAKVGSAHPGGIELTRSLVSGLRISQADRILDIGCGKGDTSILLAKTFGCEVYSVDSHEAMIKQVRSRLNHDQLSIYPVLANAENLPLQSGTFTIAFSESVLIFTDIQKSLEELARVLTDGGKLIMVEMTSEGRWSQEEMDEVTTFYNIDFMPTEKEWIDSLTKAGFKNINVLKASTVHEEISKGLSSGKTLSAKQVPNKQAEQRLIQQSILLAKYGDLIGYRVMEAEKP